jgi:hypothetical protein
MRDDIDIPRTIVSLLRGEPGNFDPGVYFRRFALSQYAYLEGFNEFCEACVLEGGFKSGKLAIAAVQQATSEAVTLAPDDWSDQFPNGQWDVCAAEQVTAARYYSPMCLEKSLLIILATAIACRRPAYGALHKLNPFNFISIHPAIYRLTGQETWAVLLNQLSGRMRRSELALISDIQFKLQNAAPRNQTHATPARARELIRQAFEGRGMTWNNANLLRTAFNGPVFGSNAPAKDAPGEDCLSEKMDVAVLDGRNDGGRLSNNKHCNDAEGPFVTPSKSNLETLRAVVRKSA